MTDSNDDTTGRPPRGRAERPRTGGDRAAKGGPRSASKGPSRSAGKGGPRFGDKDSPRPAGKGGARPFKARGDDRPSGGRRFEDRDAPQTGWRPEGPRRAGRPFEDADAGEGPRRTRDVGERPARPARPAGDRPFRSRDGDRPARPAGDRPFRAGGDDRPARAAGDRPFRSRDGDRPARPAGDRPFRSRDGDGPARAPRAGGDRPFRSRDDARPRSAPRDETRHDEARAPKVLPAEARLVADEPAEERIAKVIARAGIASRRDAEAMIADGRVTLNGEVLTSPAVNVGKDDRITVDGEPLPARERTRLWLFHKPRGLVTTARDPEGRPTVFDNLPEDLPRVVAVGRLDINTEGLLLLTNDGGLAKVIAHPDTGWLRRYRVRAHGEVTQADLDRLRDGVTVDGMEYGPVEARLDREQGDNVWITLGLREGKNREVKRILDHLGLSVNRLIRLSFGPFQLGDIEPGLVEEVRTRVLRDQLGEALAAEAGVDFESAVREPIAPFGTKPERDEAPRRREERPARGRDDAPRGGRGRDEDRPARGLDERSPRGRAEPERVKRDPLEPRRSVWRAPGDEPRPARKTPRRGADPREARAQSAEREHERVGAITAGEGRKVLVERLVSAPAPEADDRPRRPRTAGADRPTRRPDRDEAPRSSGDRPYGAKRPAGAGSDRPARSRRPEGASEDRPYRARTGGPGSERPYRARKPEGAGSDRPYRGGKPEGAGSDRPYRARKPEGAGSDRPFRSRDAEPSPRGADDRPRRGPPRGDAPGRGADDRPRRGPPRGDGPGRGGPPGRGGAKGGSKGGAKGGGRSGPGGRGGPRGRS